MRQLQDKIPAGMRICADLQPTGGSGEVGFRLYRQCWPGRGNRDRGSAAVHGPAGGIIIGAVCSLLLQAHC